MAALYPILIKHRTKGPLCLKRPGVAWLLTSVGSRRWFVFTEKILFTAKNCI